MTTSTPPDNTILVLRPPRVIEATTPVVGAIYGVPKHVYDLKPMGLTIAVDPPASGTVDAGDVIRLVLNGASTEATKTIPDGGENNIQTLYLPIGLLLTDLVNELVYTITRGSLNKGTSTPALTLLYNRIRPGLKDRLTDPGGHSELKLLLPDAIKNGVAPDFVSAEVCVAYPYCRAYDRISLKCNGELMTADVNPNQAPQPPDHGSEVPITICFTVDRAYLDKAKRLDHKLNFSYTVTDQLGNGPDTDAPWSPAQTVDEDLDGVLLPMPILLERLEDFPGDDASIIDLEKLAGNPLLMVVITADNRFVAGDDVLATYTAKNTGQPADVVVTVPGKVEADPFGSKKTLFLEMANDKVFAGSIVTVTYELRRPNGDLVGNSKPAKATVTGAAPIKLLKPKIKQAPNDTSLEPLAAKDALTAVIPAYPNMIGTQVTVTWSGTAGSGSQTVGPINVSTQGDLNIPLDNAVVAFNLGKTVKVAYTVTGNSTPSDPLDLSVLPIADENPAMGIPLITQAANNGAGPEFDVSKLTTAATVRVNRWPLIALAQYVWLRLTGTKKDGNNYDETFWQPPGSQTNTTWISQGYWERSIPLATLQNLKDGSELTLEFKAGLGGSQDVGLALIFKKRIYTVKAVEDVKPEITMITGSPSGDEIPPDGKTLETAVIVTGTASKGQAVNVYDGITLKDRAEADPDTGIWTLKLSDLKVETHRITAEAIYGSGAVSAPRMFEVLAKLNFGTALTLSLPNYSVVRGIPPLNPVGEAAYTRTPTGGIEPYRFSSSNTNVALIDANTGKVRVSGRGTTTLKVTDHQNNEATYTLTTTGLKMFIRLGNFMTEPDAERACINAGGGLPNNRAELRAVYNTYKGQPGGIVAAANWLPNNTWTNEGHPQTNHFWVIRMEDGADSFAHTIQGQSAVACRVDT